ERRRRASFLCVLPAFWRVQLGRLKVLSISSVSQSKPGVASFSWKPAILIGSKPQVCMFTCTLGQKPTCIGPPSGSSRSDSIQKISYVSIAPLSSTPTGYWSSSRGLMAITESFSRIGPNSLSAADTARSLRAGCANPSNSLLSQQAGATGLCPEPLVTGKGLFITYQSPLAG